MDRNASIWYTSRRALWLGGALSILMEALGYFSPSAMPGSGAVSLTDLLWSIPIIGAGAWAGSLVYSAERKFFRAGLAAILVFFVVHPLVHGLMFTLHAIFGSVAELPMVLGGVAVSFLMFAPVFFVAGIAGAVCARLAIHARAA